MSPVHAQNRTFDARNVGLGGVDSGGNVAVNMVDEQRRYRAIVLPFGLLQILPDIGKLNPTHDDFDLIRARRRHIPGHIHRRRTVSLHTDQRGDRSCVDGATRKRDAGLCEQQPVRSEQRQRDPGGAGDHGWLPRAHVVGGGLNGLYIGANYHYRKGFRYEGFDLGARLDTDAAGLLTVNPLLGSPLLVNRHTATSGSGFAVDMGVTAVADRWEVGFSVNGIANRIDWNDVERVGYSLGSLSSGGDFLETARSLEPGVRVELPVDVRASAWYNADAFTMSAEFANGYNGTTFCGGYEYRLSRVQLRGGGRYLGERFEPTGGVGFNSSDHIGMDVAAFATSANLERKRQLAIAVSLRFTRKTE